MRGHMTWKELITLFSDAKPIHAFTHDGLFFGKSFDPLAKILVRNSKLE